MQLCFVIAQHVGQSGEVSADGDDLPCNRWLSGSGDFAQAVDQAFAVAFAGGGEIERDAAPLRLDKRCLGGFDEQLCHHLIVDQEGELGASGDANLAVILAEQTKSVLIH